jgi:hypothetical protein
MSPQSEFINHFDKIKIAFLIAVILGLITSVFFMVAEKDSYSSIYLVTGSVFHNEEFNTVVYEYGVKSSESGKMDYTLETYVNSIPVKSRLFSLNKGEVLDTKDEIILPRDIQYPSKISLRLTTVTGIEEIHFWIGRDQNK